MKFLPFANQAKTGEIKLKFQEYKLFLTDFTWKTTLLVKAILKLYHIVAFNTINKEMCKCHKYQSTLRKKKEKKRKKRDQ